MLFYDLTDQNTFNNTKSWLYEIHEHTEGDIIVMLVGNKFDLTQENPGSRGVNESDAKAFANENGLLYSETSAKTGYNVKEAFETLVETIYEKQKQKGFQPEEKVISNIPSIKLTESDVVDKDSKTEKGCCS